MCEAAKINLHQNFNKIGSYKLRPIWTPIINILKTQRGCLTYFSQPTASTSLHLSHLTRTDLALSQANLTSRTPTFLLSCSCFTPSCTFHGGFLMIQMSYSFNPHPLPEKE
jgi:hypothetical protein